MRSFTCECGGDLYFHSTHCVACGLTVGMCPVCLTVSSTQGSVADRSLRCGNPVCGAAIEPCRHRLDRTWCNRWVDRNEAANSDAGTGPGSSLLGKPKLEKRGDASAGQAAGPAAGLAAGVAAGQPAAAASVAPLCIDCRLTTHLPDLRPPEHTAQVQRTEFAKQRTLYALRIIGLPIDGPTDPLPLTFRFLHDAKNVVTTGHQNGVITINLREADPVQREAARVRFGEPQRTLVGHFRHELGHYYWQRLVQPDASLLGGFRKQFGDENTPAYGLAMSQYYAAPPRGGWDQNFVSAYATMHPWEDFAETFNTYLDMRAVLETAAHFRIRSDRRPPKADETRFERMMLGYMATGLVANELNRDLGLPDLVPEVFTRPVRAKLQWIDSLVQRFANPHQLPNRRPLRPNDPAPINPVPPPPS